MGRALRDQLRRHDWPDATGTADDDRSSYRLMFTHPYDRHHVDHATDPGQKTTVSGADKG